MMRTLARRTKVWRSRTRGAGVLPARRNTRHSIRATSATAFIGTTGSRSSFLPPRRVRAPPTSSVLLPNLHCSSRTWLRGYDLLAAARGCQRPLGQADQNFLRRCSAPTALNRRDDPNLIRRIGTRMYAIANWETGSGRFGGCLIKIAKLGRSRPGIQATSPIFDPLGVARLPLFGNFPYSAFFAPC